MCNYPAEYAPALASEPGPDVTRADDLLLGQDCRVFDSWPPYPPWSVQASAECLARGWQDELKELQDQLKEAEDRSASARTPWRRLRAAALNEALRAKHVHLDGAPADLRAFPHWFAWSPMVDAVRAALADRRITS